MNFAVATTLMRDFTGHGCGSLKLSVWVRPHAIQVCAQISLFAASEFLSIISSKHFSFSRKKSSGTCAFCALWNL